MPILGKFGFKKMEQQQNVNPLIGDNSVDTLNNAIDAFNELVMLLSHKNNGLCLLIQPILNAIEHVAQHQQE